MNFFKFIHYLHRLQPLLQRNLNQIWIHWVIKNEFWLFFPRQKLTGWPEDFFSLTRSVCNTSFIILFWNQVSYHLQCSCFACVSRATILLFFSFCRLYVSFTFENVHDDSAVLNISRSCTCLFEILLKLQSYSARNKPNYGGYHKIKHFACHRDFFVHQIPRIKHTQNAPFPGIKHFWASHWLKIGWFI